MDAVTGRVVHAVVCGLDLHVFFGDGTHRRYMQPRWGIRNAAAPRVQRSELTLPDSGLPLAVTADASHPVLYTLVTARQAARIDALERRHDDANDDAVPEETKDTPPERPPDPSGADCALVRYETGRWQSDRNAPPDLTLDADVLALLAASGAIHLIYRSSSEETTYIHRASLGPDAAWSEPKRLPLHDQPTHHASGWESGRPVLVVGRRAEEGVVVQSIRWIDEAWSSGAPLVNDEGQPIAFKPPLSVTMFDSQVAVITVGKRGDGQVGRWALDTGKPLGPFKRVAPLAPLPRPMRHSTAQVVIQYAVLAGVLTAVFAWRRGAILTPVSLRPGQTPAPLLRRGAALFIDVLILVPVWGLALFYLVQHAAGDLSPAEQLAFGLRAIAPDNLWSWAILGAVVGLYAAILEAATGTTLGKWLAGLYVVAHGGDRCRAHQILLRNAARIIEFPLAPLVLLVALTPGRQRLGDIFGRTVVVGWADPSSSETPSDSDNDGDGTRKHL
jgi:uncharacterized RDD family membrane protein YckC